MPPRVVSRSCPVQNGWLTFEISSRTTGSVSPSTSRLSAEVIVERDTANPVVNLRAVWLGGLRGEPTPLAGASQCFRQLCLLVLAADKETRLARRRARLVDGGGRGFACTGPHYHANYYGAFVIGPDGHNVEAVCHKPQVAA